MEIARTSSANACSPWPRKISDNCINSQRSTERPRRGARVPAKTELGCVWFIVEGHTIRSEEAHDGSHFYSERKAPNRRRLAANAPAMGFARLARYDRHQVRLRHGAVRRLHCSYQRSARPFLRYADFKRR